MTTRASIRLSARVAADQDNSDFPTEDACNDIIDRAASAVWRRLLAAGWTPARTIVTIPATGATSYPLGTDVHSVQSVQYLQTSTTRIPMRRIKPEELADFLNTTGGQPAAYLIVGGATSTTTIEFYPVPTSGTFEVRYIPRFAGFQSDSDPWYGADGSDELIILTSAVDMVAKESGDTSALRQKLQDRWAEVCDAMQSQDAQGQQTVRDTRGLNNTQQWINAFNYNAMEGWD